MTNTHSIAKRIYHWAEHQLKLLFLKRKITFMENKMKNSPVGSDERRVNIYLFHRAHHNLNQENQSYRAYVGLQKALRDLKKMGL